MEARVKATGEIIQLKGDDVIYYDVMQDCLEEIELLEENSDYWEKLKHQYAGMAMQGMLANANHYLWERKQNSKSLVANAAELAHALVEKYKKEGK